MFIIFAALLLKLPLNPLKGTWSVKDHSCFGFSGVEVPFGGFRGLK